MRNVMKNMVLPMAALALLEDLANGAIRRKHLLANDDNWLISRFRMCDKVGVISVTEFAQKQRHLVVFQVCGMKVMQKPSASPPPSDPTTSF